MVYMNAQNCSIPIFHRLPVWYAKKFGKKTLFRKSGWFSMDALIKFRNRKLLHRSFSHVHLIDHTKKDRPCKELFANLLKLFDVFMWIEKSGTYVSAKMEKENRIYTYMYLPLLDLWGRYKLIRFDKELPVLWVSWIWLIQIESFDSKKNSDWNKWVVLG